MKRLFFGSVLVTLALLLGVMLFQWIKQLTTGAQVSMSGSYSSRAILSGLVADVIRGCVVTWLYQNTRSAGSSLLHAVWFGILTSVLVATLYVFYQYGAMQELGLGFLTSKTAIILLQGVLSGLALFIVFRNDGGISNRDEQ